MLLLVLANAAALAGAQASDIGRPQSAPMSFERDANHNRVIISGSASQGSRLMANPARRHRQDSRAIAIANMVNVTVHGSNNTVVVNARQASSGNQKAVVAASPASLGQGG